MLQFLVVSIKIIIDLIVFPNSPYLKISCVLQNYDDNKGLRSQVLDLINFVTKHMIRFQIVVNFLYEERSLLQSSNCIDPWT